MKAPLALALLLVIATCTVTNSHRLILQASPALDGTQQQSTQPSGMTSPQPLPSGTNASNSGLNDTWPFPEVPIKLMSCGDLLARGGAVRALGRAKLQRIKQQSSVSLNVEALARSMDSDDDLVSGADAKVRVCSWMHAAVRACTGHRWPEVLSHVPVLLAAIN
jgi:hypothetical protein